MRTNRHKVAVFVAILLGLTIGGFVFASPSALAATTQEILALHKLPEPLVPVGKAPTPDDNQALLAALAAFESRKEADDFSALEQFVAGSPQSPWRFATQLNLGLLYYRAGYYSKCLPAFLEAWKAGKNATDRNAKALADRAAGEYAKMLARLGRYDELKAFLAQVRDREFPGPAGELIAAGKEGAVTMEKHPDLSFRCGPMALGRVLASQHSPMAISPDILNSKSTMQGISLADVAALSQKVGLNYQPAKRPPGAALILPAVIHWKVGHYAALIKKVGDRYLTQDPTFQSETWHTLKALEAEASGYFLVPSGPLPDGWTSVSDTEAKGVFGKGATSGSNSGGTGPNDGQGGGCGSCPCPPPPSGGGPPGSSGGPSSGGGNSGSGTPLGGANGAPPPPVPAPPMATYSFHLMLASLRITDTPVSYAPPYGFPVPFTVTYCQREASQPSVFNYTNFGPQWNCNWISFITDDPSNPATASEATPGGGTILFSFTGQSNGKYVFAPQFDTSQQLSRPTTGLPYTVVNADGSQEIYGLSDGSTAAPRKVFLTQFIDPSGNATTLTYDGQFRITAITDALGRQITLSYNLGGDAFKVTQATDPFGRTATFSYDVSGRLIQIQDAIGIQSKFTYEGASTFINALTTPYGTTTFTFTESGLDRWLSATDPAGATEVVEASNFDNPGIDAAIPPDPNPPQGLNPVGVFNSNLILRNSFYWNKKQWAEQPGVYTNAHIFHWLHDLDGLNMGRYLESEKEPLENRVWYNYPGSVGYEGEGSSSVPFVVGQFIEGGSQVTTETLNAINRVTSITDPVGRTTNFQYATNNIDVVLVTQTVNGSPVTVASYTYDNAHHPLTSTDAAGQTTTYVWNAQGQITSVTDPLSNVTTYTYYTADATGHQRNHRIQQIIGALPGNADVVTYDYDAVGRVSSITGPDGYTVSYAYDAIDRPTQIGFPDGTSTKFTYLALDLQTVVDRLGRTANYVYNSIRQLASVTDPDNRTTQYRWCKCGALSQVTDAAGRSTTFTYDSVGRPTTRTYSDGSSTAYTYEPLSGRLSTTTDEKGQVKTRSYNLDNSLASLTYTNAAVATPNISFAYDPSFPRFVSMTDGNGVTNFSYAAIGSLGAGLISSVALPLPNATIAYTYDALGRRTAYAVGGVGETVNLDTIGRATSAVNPLGTFAYNYVGATSRLNSVTYPNGQSSAYAYQPLANNFRLLSITNNLPGNTVLSQNTYTYDAEDNLTRWTKSVPSGSLNLSWSIGHDMADQVTSVASQNSVTLQNLPAGQYAYTFDQTGNRVSATLDANTTTIGFNSANQVVNANGPDVSSLASATYSWDAENRLSAINYSGTNNQTQFTYDGFGRCVQIKELTGTTVNSTKQMVWDGASMVEEWDSAVGASKRFFERGVQITSGVSAGNYYYTLDHLGSVREMTDSTTAVRAVYDYDAYGLQTKLAGNLDADFGFGGLYFHQPSSLNLAVFRAYSPRLGRWISRDPLGLTAGPNLYAYVDNNPLNYTDPLGLEGGLAGKGLDAGKDALGSYLQDKAYNGTMDNVKNGPGKDAIQRAKDLLDMKDNVTNSAASGAAGALNTEINHQLIRNFDNGPACVVQLGNAGRAAGKFASDIKKKWVDPVGNELQREVKHMSKPQAGAVNDAQDAWQNAAKAFGRAFGQAH